MAKPRKSIRKFSPEPKVTIRLQQLREQLAELRRRTDPLNGQEVGIKIRETEKEIADLEKHLARPLSPNDSYPPGNQEHLPGLPLVGSCRQGASSSSARRTAPLTNPTSVRLRAQSRLAFDPRVSQMCQFRHSWTLGWAFHLGSRSPGLHRSKISHRRNGEVCREYCSLAEDSRP